MASFWLFISLVATHQGHLYQLDIKNALLHGIYNEEAYMDQPTEFVTWESSKVCHLRKLLDGLKQSAQAG